MQKKRKALSAGFFVSEGRYEQSEMFHPLSLFYEELIEAAVATEIPLNE